MANSNKAMDVSKPGKVTADASAKPIIVTHRPMVQDPMVKQDTDVSDLETEKDATEEVKTSPTAGEKVIQPINEGEKNDSDKVETSEAIDTKADEPGSADQTTSATKEKEVKEEKPSSSEAAEVDAMADQASSKHKEKQAAEQEAAKQEHLQKLIDSKKYFVKTGQVARRRNNRIALTLLILILVMLGLYAAVDAGVIKPGFDVPIHVIHT